MAKLVQINANHARHSHDLLLQTMRERDVDLAVIAEPHNIGDDGCWFGSDDARPTAAIFWRRETTSLSCLLRTRGRGYVAVTWRGIIAVSCYISPSKPTSQFETILDDLSAVIRRYKLNPILVIGDFNARSMEWDVRRNIRGDLLAD